MSLSLQQIDQGIEALVLNAESLVGEARLLLEKGAYSRSFALANLAREEMSKAAMLQAAGTRLLAEHPVNWKQLFARLRDHKSKLRLEIVEAALLFKGHGMNEFADEVLASVHHTADYRNDRKNAALYVAFEGREFVSPKDQFTLEQAERTICLAEMRLKQLRTFMSRLGPYALREIGSLRDMPNPDQWTPEQRQQSVDLTAEYFAQMMKDSDRDSDS